MTAHAPGWFGKLGMLGDFASRRLQPQWVRDCDRWLAECVSGSAQALGERWLSAYLNAPVWRFAWGPGIIDPHWWFGVLMPSCDNVGRYFPLVVAQSRQAPPADRFALDHLELWWSHVAEAALATLDEVATLETFESALHDAPPWPGAAPGEAWASTGAETLALPPGASLIELVHGLAAAGLRQRMAGHSLWWPMAAPGARNTCLVLAGLPDAGRFADMLAG